MGSVTTVLSRLEEIGSRKPELAFLESKLDDLNPDIVSITVLEDTFVVHDLLEGYSFIVARSQSGYRLTFALRDGSQIVVAVEAGADITLVAQKIADRLMQSGTRMQRLELSRPVDSTEGV